MFGRGPHWRVVVRHIALTTFPVLLGLAAGQVFAASQESCTRLVGPLFSASCHGRLLEYRLAIQTAGTIVGAIGSALVGIWLEHRRRRQQRQVEQDVEQDDVGGPVEGVSP